MLRQQANLFQQRFLLSYLNLKRAVFRFRDGAEWHEMMVRNGRKLKGVRLSATTDLEEGGPSGDVLQRTRVDAASPLSLWNPQVSVADHRGGGEGGVGAARAITGLRGGGMAG